MRARTAEDARRLLESIDAHQSRGRVGTTVSGAEAACLVGLEAGSLRYEEAVWYLLWHGALVPDGFPDPEVASKVPFGRAPYRLTPTALKMLREEQGC